jgi:hypothetical protein
MRVRIIQHAILDHGYAARATTPTTHVIFQNIVSINGTGGCTGSLEGKEARQKRHSQLKPLPLAFGI